MHAQWCTVCFECCRQYDPAAAIMSVDKVSAGTIHERAYWCFMMNSYSLYTEHPARVLSVKSIVDMLEKSNDVHNNQVAITAYEIRQNGVP